MLGTKTSIEEKGSKQSKGRNQEFGTLKLFDEKQNLKTSSSNNNDIIGKYRIIHVR
jgi:hypothetical protein